MGLWIRDLKINCQSMNLQRTSTEYNKIALDAFSTAHCQWVSYFFVCFLCFYLTFFYMARRKPKLSLLQVGRQEAFL